MTNRPTLSYSLLWLWQAFWTLSNGRNVGFAANAIQFSEIEAYCRVERIPEVRELAFHVMMMDMVWRKHMSDEDKRKDKEEKDGTES